MAPYSHCIVLFLETGFYFEAKLFINNLLGVRTDSIFVAAGSELLVEYEEVLIFMNLISRILAKSFVFGFCLFCVAFFFFKQ